MCSEPPQKRIVAVATDRAMLNLSGNNKVLPATFIFATTRMDIYNFLCAKYNADANRDL